MLRLFYAPCSAARDASVLLRSGPRGCICVQCRRSDGLPRGCWVGCTACQLPEAVAEQNTSANLRSSKRACLLQLEALLQRIAQLEATVASSGWPGQEEAGFTP